MIWKTIGGQCIHRGMNGTQVKENRVYRWLTFGSDAIQTLINRRHPERSGLQYINALTLAARTTPAPSCLLGLGGAGVAHTLAPYFGDIPIDAIESSPDVIDIGYRFFMTNTLKNLHIRHQDAFLYVQHTTSRYQHLIIDLFNAYSFPTHCKNVDFFKLCRRILLPNGILAINLANRDEQWPMFTLICTHFNQRTLSIPVRGTQNLVILACKGESIKPLLKQLESHPQIKQLTWDSKWGFVARMV